MTKRLNQSIDPHMVGIYYTENSVLSEKQGSWFPGRDSLVIFDPPGTLVDGTRTVLFGEQTSVLHKSASWRPVETFTIGDSTLP